MPQGKYIRLSGRLTVVTGKVNPSPNREIAVYVRYIIGHWKY
jgi:hypothetical protein